MTTFTYKSYGILYDNGGRAFPPVVYQATQAVVAESAASVLRYTRGTTNGVLNDWIDIVSPFYRIQAYPTYVDMATLNAEFSPDIKQIIWPGGTANILVLTYVDTRVWFDWTGIVQISGDPLPDMTTGEQYNAFLASITSEQSLNDGPFGPDRDIPLADIGPVAVTENDTITGLDYSETLYGGIGHDDIYGGGGDNVIYGGDGNDYLAARDGNDTIYGGEGNDRLFGGAGSDLLYGGAGNNDLFGGGGRDTDTAVIDARLDSVRIEEDLNNRGLMIVTREDGVDRLSGIDIFQFTDRTLTLSEMSDIANFRIKLTGDGSDQYLRGDKGDDRLAGGGGSDTLSGASGHERLVLNSPANFKYQDPVTGEWVDKLFYKSDRLYGDKAELWYEDQATLETVFRLYRAALGRDPDMAGHLVHSQALLSGSMTIEALAKAMVDSPEFQTRFGADMSNADFVKLLFQNVLGRQPAKEGAHHWSEALRNGLSRAEAVAKMSMSEEFTEHSAKAAEAFARTHDPASWSDDVYHLYRATLGRDPDREGFLSLIENFADGRSMEITANGFIRSAEFTRIYGTDLTNTEFAQLLFQNVLGRQPEASGLNAWVRELDAGMSRAAAVINISASPEFAGRSHEGLVDFMRGLGTDDVLLAGNGRDVLAGGILSDAFVFDTRKSGAHTVLDFEAWDQVWIDAAAGQSAAAVLAAFSQEGEDVFFVLENTWVAFKGADLAWFNSDTVQIRQINPDWW